MKNLSLFCFLNCALSIILFSGCGGPLKPNWLPKLYPVALTITQDGKPLADADVMLSSGERWLVGGRTDVNGVVQLRTEGQFPGVPVGMYKVAVLKIETSGGEHQGLPDPDPSGMTANDVKAYDCVEKKYQDADTSGLILKVKAGKNEETFDVGKAVRVEIKLMGM